MENQPTTKSRVRGGTANLRSTAGVNSKDRRAVDLRQKARAALDLLSKERTGDSGRRKARPGLDSSSNARPESTPLSKTNKTSRFVVKKHVLKPTCYQKQVTETNFLPKARTEAHSHPPHDRRKRRPRGTPGSGAINDRPTDRSTGLPRCTAPPVRRDGPVAAESMTDRPNDQPAA